MPQSALGLRPAPAAGATAARRRPAACTGCRRRARTTRATCSRSTAGANGRNDSRNLIFRFITDCIFGDRASPMIERPPSARGPNSIRPWNRPTTFSSAISAATRSASAAGSNAARRIAASLDETLDLVVGELRAEDTSRSCRRRTRGGRTGLAPLRDGRSHVPERSPGSTRGLLEIAMPQAQRHAERAARVAGRRLNPDLLERPSRRMRPLPTQFSATPPARHRSRIPVSRSREARSSSASPLR